MQPQREVYVAGQAITPFIGKGSPHFGPDYVPDLEQLMHDALQTLQANCPFDPALMDRVCVANFGGELFCNQALLGGLIMRVEPRLSDVGCHRVEAACASGGIAITSGVESIQSGCDLVLVLGAEVQTNIKARQGADYLARASHYKTERSIDDFTFPALLTRRTKHYKETYELTEHDLAHFSVKAYSNANRNPLAHMHATHMTLEHAELASDSNPQILKNPDLKPHLKVSDCSQVSDGASVVILASKKGLEKLQRSMQDCVRIRSYGIATGALGQVKDPGFMDITAKAVKEALHDANQTPDQIEVAEVHDCFTIAELLMYEAIGWAKPGEGMRLMQEGRTSIEGDLPVNTGGGLVGFGHPVGATGIKQVAEITRQMKGQCGDYQIPRSLQRGLTANMGGDDRTCVSIVLENTV